MSKECEAGEPVHKDFVAEFPDKNMAELPQLHTMIRILSISNNSFFGAAEKVDGTHFKNDCLKRQSLTVVYILFTKFALHCFLILS